MLEKISVVIPCLNEEQYIKKCVESILLNGYPTDKLEVLVVDGGSTDNTLDILAELTTTYPQIKVIHNEKKATPFALNLGIEKASNPFILIAGAHAEYPENYISTLLKAIQEADIDVIGGAIETVTKNENTKSNSIKYVLSHPLGVGNAMFRIGASELLQVDTVPFGIYPKEVFEKVGTYNVKLIRNHDMELSKRILAHGYKIWMDPTQKVKYYARETFKGLFKNNYGNGFWNIKTVWITRNFKSLSIRHFVPLVFVLSLIVPILGAFIYKYIALLSIFSLFLYLLSVFVIAARGPKESSFFQIVKSFFTLHFSYGLGSLMAIFSLLNYRK